MTQRDQNACEQLLSVGAHTPIPIARPLSDFSVEQVGDDLVILDGETMQYHMLNASATLILERCDGQHTAESIAAELGLPDVDVEETIDDLGIAGLFDQPAELWPKRLSRRRATKLIGVGIAGAVGAPMIRSITVPDSVAAATAGQCFGFIVNPAFCFSGLCAVACQIAGGGTGGSCQTITSGPGRGNACCVCNRPVSGASFDAAVEQIQAGDGETQQDAPVNAAVVDENEEIVDETPSTELQNDSGASTDDTSDQQDATQQDAGFSDVGGDDSGSSSVETSGGQEDDGTPVG